MIRKKQGEILDFGLLNPRLLLLLFRSRKELMFEGYDLANASHGEPGLIAEDLNCFQLDRASLINVECLNETGNPYTLALVLPV